MSNIGTPNSSVVVRMYPIVCPSCRGTGKTATGPFLQPTCKACNGDGVVTVTETITPRPESEA